ncbi:hypothetical protein MRX96_043188 [Rhipicephalus microplus]
MQIGPSRNGASSSRKSASAHFRRRPPCFCASRVRVSRRCSPERQHPGPNDNERSGPPRCGSATGDVGDTGSLIPGAASPHPSRRARDPGGRGGPPLERERGALTLATRRLRAGTFIQRGGKRRRYIAASPSALTTAPAICRDLSLRTSNVDVRMSTFNFLPAHAAEFTVQPQSDKEWVIQ